ncbi:MAG: S4 domain-containing protein [Rikenellaceae bacterium]
MGVRADKFVWAVRLAKTRSDAAEALKGGRVLINGVNAKPSRELSIGDVIGVKRMPAIFSYKIIGITERRVGAKLVSDYLLDITSAEEVEKLEMSRLASMGVRERGAGRPTKRERRDIEEFLFNE